MKIPCTCSSCGRAYEYDTIAQSGPVLCPACFAAAHDSIPSYAIGSKIGDYEIISPIGIGGMGEVFLAEQSSMKRKVALKILQPSLAKNPQYLERFFNEVRTLAQIEHPGVVKAIDAGMHGPTCYFSMVFVPGKDLKRMIDSGYIFPELEAVSIVRIVADALDYVWKKHKLIHRDIKPANIVLTPENEVALMDLGISKSLENKSDVTTDGMMVGSPAYISPEQARADKDIDFRADMYSLGATLFHMLTGVPPFDADNSVAIISKHFTEPIPDPRLINPAVSDNTVALIYKMMAKNKKDRYESWDELIKATSAILEPPEQPPAAVPETVRKYSALNTLKDNAVAKLKKVSPYRLIALLILLILFLIMFGSVISKSIREDKFKRSSQILAAAQNLMKSEDQASRTKAMTLLDTLNKSEFPSISQEAAKSLEKLRTEAIQKKENSDIARKQDALASLKRKAFDFEKNNDYLSAIQFWDSYRKTGEFRNEKDFVLEIERSLDYLKRKQKQKESGLLDE